MGACGALRRGGLRSEGASWYRSARGLPCDRSRRFLFQVSMHPGAWGLERAQEGDEVGLFLRGEPNVEAVVVEGDHVVERGRRAVVEVRRPRRQITQDRA